MQNAVLCTDAIVNDYIPARLMPEHVLELRPSYQNEDYWALPGWVFGRMAALSYRCSRERSSGWKSQARRL
jgi:hypothetical protein